MAVRDVDRAIARRMYEIAVGMVSTRETGEVSELAQKALDDPTPATIHALLAAGRGQEWLASVVDALAQTGIIASEDMLVRDVPAMSKDIKIIVGGTVAADALLEFDAAVADPAIVLIVIALARSGRRLSQDDHEESA